MKSEVYQVVDGCQPSESEQVGMDRDLLAQEGEGVASGKRRPVFECCFVDLVGRKGRGWFKLLSFFDVMAFRSYLSWIYRLVRSVTIIIYVIMLTKK